MKYISFSTFIELGSCFLSFESQILNITVMLSVVRKKLSIFLVLGFVPVNQKYFASLMLAKFRSDR
jgi:hypothetical protein